MVRSARKQTKIQHQTREMAQQLRAFILAEDQGSIFQHPHGGSQPFITIQEAPMPSTDLRAQLAHTWYTDTHVSKTFIYIK